MRRRWIKGVLVSLFITSVIFLSSGGMSPSSNVEKDLEMFFKCLFVDQAPYVLYGDKPMSMSGYSKLDFFDGYRLKPMYEIVCSIAATSHPFNQTIKKGVRLWEKKFANKPSNFLFKISSNPCGSKEIEVLLINKTSFLKVVQEHEDVFKERLASFSDPETFCQRCFASKDMLVETLEKDEVLLGILLGYGKGNAELYGKRRELWGILQSMTKEDPRYQEIKKDYLALSNLLQGFLSKQESLPFIMVDNKEQRQMFLDQYIERCPLPSFVADLLSEETIKLRESYEKTREEVQKIYRERPFLEQTLSQFFPKESKYEAMD